jgi:hypothetical protein
MLLADTEANAVSGLNFSEKKKLDRLVKPFCVIKKTTGCAGGYGSK